MSGCLGGNCLLASDWQHILPQNNIAGASTQLITRGFLFFISFRCSLSLALLSYAPHERPRHDVQVLGRRVLGEATELIMKISVT